MHAKLFSQKLLIDYRKDRNLYEKELLCGTSYPSCQTGTNQMNDMLTDMTKISKTVVVSCTTVYLHKFFHERDNSENIKKKFYNFFVIALDSPLSSEKVTK